MSMGKKPGARRQARMSCRLRKKLHLGEFAEYMFEFEAKSAVADSEATDRLLDTLIEWVEARGLSLFMTVMHGKTCGAVAAGRVYRTPTPEQRDAFAACLRTLPMLSEVRVGAFVDAWYDEPGQSLACA